MPGENGVVEDVAGPVVVRPLDEQVALKIKRTHEMFAANHGARVMESEEPRKLRLAVKTTAEYAVVKDLPSLQQPAAEKGAKPGKNQPAAEPTGVDTDAKTHLRRSAVEKVARPSSSPSPLLPILGLPPRHAPCVRHATRPEGTSPMHHSGWPCRMALGTRSLSGHADLRAHA